MKSPKKNEIPRGFQFSAAACGLRRTGGLDLALISSERPAAAAAVFTQNLVQAAPVVLSRQHVCKAAARMHAIVVNAGNANCCTGKAGMAASVKTARDVAYELMCKPEEVIVCSTGVIGVPLRVEKILHALPDVARAQAATPAAFSQVTRAIMTTDTRPKWAAASCVIGGKRVRLLGCAKGAGMIHPQMATMLAFVLTDAAISPALLRRALKEVTPQTFNAVTVDGDTSTNDTLAVLANGASGAPQLGGRSFSSDKKGQKKKGVSAPEARDYRRFIAALEKVCRELALAIVADGEGAKRVVEIEVRGAPDDRAADKIARTIAHSPLVKTALAGADPNWGRILAAAGRAGVKFNPQRADIWLAGMLVYRLGRPLPFDERAAHRKMSVPYVPIVVELRAGHGTARIWTCDFTQDYVTINASYRT